MRHILYLTGTRADYGLMQRTLMAIDRHPELNLGLVVTGMHLDPRFGDTVKEIEADGLRIAGRIPNDFDGGRSFMARAIADAISGCCDIFERERPDLVLLLGDRGEMLAGAIAAIHLNIPIAHLHGGERSGTVDEPVRHAISKLTHLHLTATTDAADRLICMGEHRDCIFTVGAPGLDGLTEDARLSRDELLTMAGLSSGSRIALMVFHPVVQSAKDGGRQIKAILSALRARGYTIIGLRPNADLGGELIRAVLESEKAAADLKLYTHMQRSEFVSWMAAADVMIGNSSAGIIEAASFGTPVINVGSRQQLRERNANVLDTEPDPLALIDALIEVERKGRFQAANIYGDGHSAPRIASLLAQLPLEPSLLDKACAF
ncbi:MAG: UDP-N-acetylglucosamine 2-epimerase [Sphingorhabdus sp.]